MSAAPYGGPHSQNFECIIVSRDPLPRPVWEEKKIFSFPDRSGRIKVYIPSQTGLGRVNNIQLPRPVWEAESLCC